MKVIVEFQTDSWDQRDSNDLEDFITTEFGVDWREIEIAVEDTD